MNFYNENDPHAAQWLDNLIAADLIPRGKVDRRSIKEIQPEELSEYTQSHFFAGIAGWPLALAMAGFPADESVWTGSCPCQPFSAAGKRRGVDDERHLWPDFRRLIEGAKPSVVFGEQIASADGRQWLSGVRLDMEALGYEFGAADLCAAGQTAPHIRQRLYWVAFSRSQQKRGGNSGSKQSIVSNGSRTPNQSGGSGSSHRMVDRIESGLEGYAWNGDDWNESRRIHKEEAGSITTSSRNDFWNNFDLAYARDGKVRRIKSGVFPLAYGVPGRVAKLRGIGNAIVPQVAAEFVKAFMEIRHQ